MWQVALVLKKYKKKRPNYLAWNISKSWWRPFLSHVMVFFMLNQCRILCFKIIKRGIYYMWQVALVLKKYQKMSQTSSMKYFQIVVETFPITFNGICHVKSVKNTLFFNNYKRKLITCDRLHWCWRNTNKRPKHLAWNISKS
jgi:hypothetical protein